MGWANCGKDSKGRPIGYAATATCDHDGCKARIDRGLGYACGGDHGTGETCEKYFCGDHQVHRFIPSLEREVGVCFSCAKDLDSAKRDALYDAMTGVVFGDSPADLIRHALQWGDDDLLDSFLLSVPPEHRVWLDLEIHEQLQVQKYRQHQASIKALATAA